MSQTLTPEMIVRNHLEQTNICPRLDMASQEDVASFEQYYAPRNVYDASTGCRYHGHSALEQRAIDYGHAHFIVDRYLSAMVRHLLANDVAISPAADFAQLVLPQIIDKLDIIIDDEQAKLAAQAATGLSREPAPELPAAGQHAAPPPFDMPEYARRLLGGAMK